MKRYWEVKHGIIGLGIVIMFAILAILAPVVFPEYPGQLARIGPDYAAPEWTGFMDPSAPPFGNYVPNHGFEDESMWSFNVYAGTKGGTTDNQTGFYNYDTKEFSQGKQSVKLTLFDNSTTIGYNTGVKGVANFHYDYSFPQMVYVNFTVKSNLTGNIDPKDVKPYVQLLMPKSYTSFQSIALFEVEPVYPTEWKNVSRKLHQLGTRTIFAKGRDVTIEFGLEFDGAVPSDTGTVEFWFDNIQVFCYPAFWGPLGTTDRGQNVLAQLFWGAQVSLYIGIVATVIGVTVGLFVGLVSGYFGGIVDESLMRIVDFFLIMPGLPIMMVLSALLSPSLEVTVIVIALFAWPGPSRVIRSQVLVEKEKAYVEAAKAAGAGDVYLIFKHVFPNVLTLVFIQAATGVSGAILQESGLSFLGLTPQNLVSWGRMLQAAYATGGITIGAWWFVIPPGFMIAALSLGFVFIGYAVDKAMNPRLRKL
ncbi:MAG: ABC transporter permease [Promethearchaeota archaeon]